jgi:hypothetical protein
MALNRKKTEAATPGMNSQYAGAPEIRLPSVFAMLPLLASVIRGPGSR